MPRQTHGGEGLAGSTSTAYIVKSDTEDIAGGPCNGLYVGTGGDIVIEGVDGVTSPVFKGVPSGTFFPVRARKLMSTGTTASDIIALF